MNGVEHLVSSGRAKEAWTLASKRLAQSPPGPQAEQLLMDLVPLALHYYADRQAREWIESYRTRVASGGGPATPWHDELLKAFELAALLATKQYAEAEQLYPTVRWDLMHGLSWVVQLRLIRSIHSGDMAEALRTLRESCAPFRTPFDLGNRLRIWIPHYLDQGELRRSLDLCAAALRHFRRDPRLLSRLREIEIYGIRGRIHYEAGHYQAAGEQFLRVFEAEKTYHDTRFLLRFSQEIAWVLAKRGQFARAREFLDSLRRAPRTLDDVFCQVRLLESQARIAVDEEDDERAGSYLDRAQELLDRFPHHRRQANVHIYRATLASREARDNARCREALFHCDQAEACLAHDGKQEAHGRALIAVVRGEIHLKRNDTDRALGYCLQATEQAGNEGFTDLRARCLLLKSHLMLRANLPAEDLYEEVLRELGLIHNSAILFKAIANLYLYTWDLEDGLDLTGHHMRQLAGLKKLIDVDVFDRLFQRYVTERVMRRAWWQMFRRRPPPA